MRIHQLEYFVEIARCHSFTRAAQELLISQPALTRSIRDLEEDLGFPLFYRSGKGTFLSAEGEKFLPEAQ